MIKEKIVNIKGEDKYEIAAKCGCIQYVNLDVSDDIIIKIKFNACKICLSVKKESFIKKYIPDINFPHFTGSQWPRINRGRLISVFNKRIYKNNYGLSDDEYFHMRRILTIPDESYFTVFYPYFYSKGIFFGDLTYEDVLEAEKDISKFNKVFKGFVDQSYDRIRGL
jgi:hypothetical protein